MANTLAFEVGQSLAVRGWQEPVDVSVTPSAPSRQMPPLCVSFVKWVLNWRVRPAEWGLPLTEETYQWKAPN